MSFSLTSTTTTATITANGVDVFGVGSDNEAQARVNGTMRKFVDIVAPVLTSSFSDVTASRSLGTTFTNSSSKTKDIRVTVRNQTANAAFAVSFVLNGVTIYTLTQQAGASANAYSILIEEEIPPGATYSVVNTQAAPNLAIWQER